MSTTRLPLAQELTPKAKERGILRMKELLEKRSGRPRSREDARAAFENLLGFYVTVCDWETRAQLAERGEAADPSPPPKPAKKATKGRRAKTAE